MKVLVTSDFTTAHWFLKSVLRISLWTLVSSDNVDTLHIYRFSVCRKRTFTEGKTKLLGNTHSRRGGLPFTSKITLLHYSNRPTTLRGYKGLSSLHMDPTLRPFALGSPVISFPKLKTPTTCISVNKHSDLTILKVIFQWPNHLNAGTTTTSTNRTD